MAKRDAQKIFKRVVRNTGYLFCDLDTFHSVAMKGLFTGVNESAKESVTRIMRFIADEDLTKLLNINETNKKNIYVEQQLKNHTLRYRKNTKAAIEAACIVFAHGIIDACVYEYLTVTALAAPNLWDSWLERKRIHIELSKVKNSTYEQIRDERIIDILTKEVERKSLIYKLDLLHKIIPPKNGFNEVFGDAYDRERIVTLDDLRHNIVHKNVWKYKSLDLDKELKFWCGINYYLSRLVVESTSLILEL